MGLNFLTKVAPGLAAHAELTPEEIELETVELRDNEQAIQKIRTEIANSHAGIEGALSALDVAIGLKANDVPNNIVAATFGEHINTAGVPEDVAQQYALGCESAGEEVGNEALESAKDLIMNIVNYLIDQWHKLKALLKRTFAAKFGSVKRNLSAWRSTKARIEKYQEEGRTVEDKSKLEVKRGAAYMVLGVSGNENPRDVVAWSAIPGHLEKFEKNITELTDNLKEDLVSDASSLSEFNVKVSTIAALGPNTSGASFDTGATVACSQGDALLGRQALITQARVVASTMGDKTKVISSMNEDELRNVKKFLNGLTVGVRPSNVKIKSLNDVKVTIGTLDELEAVADAHIELATNAMALETSKKIGKIERAFDKAIQNAKKWVKDADSDSAEDKRKAITAAGMMSAFLTHVQNMSVGMVDDLVGYVSAVGKAHGAIVSQNLSRYKKA